MGTFPEWLSALAAIGALVAAIWAGLSARRLYQIESDRDSISAEARLRTDAQRVNAWTAVHLPAGRDTSTAEMQAGLVIANSGTAPIFDITVRSNDQQGREQHALVMHVLPPGEYFAGSESTNYHWSFPDPIEAWEGHVRPISKQARWRVMEISFVDAAGISWRRTPSGLERTAAPVA